MTAFREHVDAVTVHAAVDGRVHRKGQTGRARSGHASTIVVDSRVLAAARRVCRPGEHIVLVDAERVDIVRDEPRGGRS